MAKERIQKIIAKAGIASRRKAETFITDGRVRVNGKLVTELGTKADLKHDNITVEGYGRLNPEPLVYILLHKPIHVISTAHDPEGRATVLEVIEKTRAMGKRSYEGELPRIYPVGRLDFDAEGLILLTNDGDFANQMTHPRYHVPRTYAVRIGGTPDDRALERMRRGVRLQNPDGSFTRPTAPAEVQITKRGSSNAWLEMTIFEGRNHQIKRMCLAIGQTVNRLIRTDFGGVEIGEMQPGAWRFLTPDEVHGLKNWKKGVSK
ncbi:MAG: rRNA pseudouridine synthase [Deltaproteobacteria bacterium]|jgi:23S rRNA pseudouridine2605 synthase|nr:rRNA pseudouridine synthase [Deltaproteobacteria bacterium]MBT6431643.1 rRNA pseudouridine synthase [Deltaproteobacteria bacterium]